MNPNLDRLQSYPFQKLTALLAGATPDRRLKQIALHIGEPKTYPWAYSLEKSNVAK